MRQKTWLQSELVARGVARVDPEMPGAGCVAELLKRELLVVPDVKKITFFGEQSEAIFVEMSRTKMAVQILPEHLLAP